MRIQKGRPSGQCGVCRHTDRARAELWLAGGASHHSVAKKLGLSHDAVRRHWSGHVSHERKAALLMGPVQVEALAAKVAEESESILDHHRAVRAGLYQMYTAALEAGDRNGAATLAGRLIEVNNAIAKLTGQLIDSPLVQNNHLHIHSPIIQDVQNMLLLTLSPYPEALDAVVAGFEELDRKARGNTPHERPALEHAA